MLSCHRFVIIAIARIVDLYDQTICVIFNNSLDNLVLCSRENQFCVGAAVRYEKDHVSMERFFFGAIISFNLSLSQFAF